jgi:hypothetical protein
MVFDSWQAIRFALQISHLEDTLKGKENVQAPCFAPFFWTANGASQTMR